MARPRTSHLAVPRLRHLATLFVSLGIIVAPAETLAADDQPRVSFRAAGQRQKAALGYFQKSEPDPPFCFTLHGDGFGIFQDEPIVAPQGRVPARFRVGTRLRPDRVRVEMSPDRDGDGHADDRGRAVASTLRPRRRHGNTVAWLVAVRPYVVEDVIIDLFLRWRDHDGCGPEEGLWSGWLQVR